MKTKKVPSKLVLNKATISLLDTRELKQLKAGLNPWVDNLTIDPMDCEAKPLQENKQ